MNGDCSKVGRNLTRRENILSRGMVSAVQKSVVVGVLVAGIAASPAAIREAHAQAQGPQALSIEDALRSAEEGAAGILAARAKVVGAQRGVDAARSGYFPQVNGSASYGLTLASEFADLDLGALVPNYGDLLCPFDDDPRDFFCEQRYQDLYNPQPTEGGDSGGGLPFGQRNTWRAGISVAQPIYDGGRTRANVRNAKLGVALAKLSEQQIRASAVFGAARIYYSALLAQRSVAITEASLASAQAVLDQAQLQNANGALAEFDVVRAEVARDNERNRLVTMQVLRENQFVLLKRALRIPLDREITLTSSLDLADANPDNDGVIAKAVAAAGLTAQGKRLLLTQAELSVAASKNARAVAAADRLPQITAVSDFGLVNYDVHPFNPDWTTNWTVGVNLSIPIFDGFRRRALVRQADAEVAAARANLEDAERLSGMDAAMSDVQISAALTRWQTSARTVVLARRANEIAELRFAQGASSQLELVDARLQLNLAEVNQATAAHDLRVAWLRLALLPGLQLLEGT